MANELDVLKTRVERLRRLHLKALGAFNAYEQIQEYRANNIHGKELAHQHAEAMGVYKGFFNIAENALNTELHIALAKLYDSHKDALHIERLVNYAEQNQGQITVEQQSALNDDVAKDLARAYVGMGRDDLKQIKTDLEQAADKITRLKALRDNRVAHEDLHGRAIDFLTFQELIDLIELSRKIINLVSARVYGDTALFDIYESQVISDTKALLQLVGKSYGIIEKE